MHLSKSYLQVVHQLLLPEANLIWSPSTSRLGDRAADLVKEAQDAQVVATIGVGLPRLLLGAEAHLILIQ